MNESSEEFLACGFRSTGEMFSYITDTFGKKLSDPVHLFVFHPGSGVGVEDIEQRAANRGLTLHTKAICDNLYRTTIRVKKRAVDGFLVIADEWWILISRGRGSVIRAVVVDSFVNNHMFPYLQSSHIDVDSMLEIVEDLGSVYESLVLEEYSMAGERGTLREWLRSGMAFSVEYAHQLQDKSNASFTGLKIACGTGGAVDAKFRIYTQNQLTFYSGSFGDMFEFVVMPFVRRSMKSQRTYSGREMKVDAGKVSLFGVRVTGRSPFEEKDITNIEEFIRKTYSTVLMYRNPVTVFQATDRRDGSSFDVYLTTESIEIVPLSRSSPGALIELCASVVRRLPPYAKYEPIPAVETLFA